MKGKYSRSRAGGTGVKVLMLVLALVLTATCSIGGTLAWMVAKTDAVVNTFTYGDIKLELWEHDYIPTSNTLDEKQTVKENKDYTVLPGVNLPKDPYVTVGDTSEDCWLFVKIEETGWPAVSVAGETTQRNEKINWAIDGTDVNDTEWTLVAGETNVYCRKVLASDTIKTFDILKDNQITVSGDLTKGEIKNMSQSFNLTITAYACQLNNGNNGEFDAEEAWAIVSNKGFKPPAPSVPTP